MQGLKTKYATLGNYILVKTLGCGYNSKVKLAYDASTNQYCALKIIRHSHPALNLKNIKKEIEILKALNHPNIVNLVDFKDDADYVKKNGESYKVVAIAIELAPGGELFEYIADSGRFSQVVARTYFRILIDTLEYCHSQGIAHRDLKPENLLFDAGFNLKVADFGFAALLAGKDGSGELQTVLGTESYMAPEIHMKKPYSGTSVDLFACGIILFIMVSGTPPFGRADPKNDPHYGIFSSDKREIFWKAHERNKPKKTETENFYSDEFKDLINNMLALEPTARFTIEQIKQHPWYNGPTATVMELRAEFLQRKKVVDEEIKKQKEAKKQQKLMAKMQQAHHAQGAFTGIQPFRSLTTLRSLEEGAGNVIQKELKDVNFEDKREILDYQSQAGFKAYTEVFTVMSPEFVFKVLCFLAAEQDRLANFTVSKQTYKIQGKAVKDDGSCNVNIVLTKVDENTTCIEFHKKSGNIMTFYKVVDEFKKALPTVELVEKSEESASTEAQ